jgi:hypothetical protein
VVACLLDDDVKTTPFISRNNELIHSNSKLEMSCGLIKQRLQEILREIYDPASVRDSAII